MAQVAYGTSNDFNALIYGAQKNDGTMRWLENQFSNFSQTLTDAGRSFFNNAQQLFDQFNSAEAMRNARAAIRRVSNIFQPDVIRPIWEMADCQNASPVMQRWIMAEPTIRQLYIDQRCDGFSDTYVDVDPGRLGNDHYDYRRVMDGMLQDTEDESSWVIKNWFEDLYEGDRELNMDEKMDVINLWSFIESYAKAGGEDPSNACGGSL